jgi:hypothetical protein
VRGRIDSFARGDHIGLRRASPVLQLAEHAFDKVSAFVGFGVERIRRPS